MIPFSDKILFIAKNTFSNGMLFLAKSIFKKDFYDK